MEKTENNNIYKTLAHTFLICNLNILFRIFEGNRFLTKLKRYLKYKYRFL